MSELDNLKTMRDINDYCVAKGIPSLAQGMIELPPPLKLRQFAAEEGLSDPIHTYRARMGETCYLDAIKSFLQRDYNTTVETNNILTTQGVTGGIIATISLVQELGGSRIGVIEPFYTYHLFQIERLLGKPAPVEYVSLKGADDGFSPDWDRIEKALVPKGEPGHLDILILTNPSNPTGRVWLKEELDRVVQLTKASGTWLLIDECYSDMVWEPHVHYSPIQTSLEDHVVVVRGFSKVLGCQSWRVGYTISSAATIAQLMRAHDQLYICVPWLQHALSRYFLETPEDFSDHKSKISDLIRSNWVELSAALKTHLGWEPLEPHGTMYGMLRHNEKTDMDAVKIGLSKGVGVCPGTMFFANNPEHTGFVRIHMGVSKEKTARILSLLSA